MLISSVATHTELRWIFRRAALINLDRIISFGLMVSLGRLVHYMFGVKLVRDKKSLRDILGDMSPAFIS